MTNNYTVSFWVMSQVHSETFDNKEQAFKFYLEQLEDSTVSNLDITTTVNGERVSI